MREGQFRTSRPSGLGSAIWGARWRNKTIAPYGPQSGLILPQAGDDVLRVHARTLPGYVANMMAIAQFVKSVAAAYMWFISRRWSLSGAIVLLRLTAVHSSSRSSLNEDLATPNSVVFDTINPSDDRANAPLAAAPGPLPCLHLLYQIVVIDIHGFTAVMIAKLYPGAIGGLNANVGTAAPRTISGTINDPCIFKKHWIAQPIFAISQPSSAWRLDIDADNRVFRIV